MAGECRGYEGGGGEAERGRLSERPASGGETSVVGGGGGGSGGGGDGGAYVG